MNDGVIMIPLDNVGYKGWLLVFAQSDVENGASKGMLPRIMESIRRHHKMPEFPWCDHIRLRTNRPEEGFYIQIYGGRNTIGKHEHDDWNYIYQGVIMIGTEEELDEHEALQDFSGNPVPPGWKHRMCSIPFVASPEMN